MTIRKSWEKWFFSAIAGIILFATGYVIGVYRTEQYFRDWLIGWGCGEYYLDDSHQIQFRLKKP